MRTAHRRRPSTVYRRAPNNAFRAVDSAGNADPTPATRSFDVDLSAPNTLITSGPANGSTIDVRNATFEFEGVPGADTAKLQCKLDSNSFSNCTSPKTFYRLADGEHTVEFRGVDANGNADPTPAKRTFKVAIDKEITDPFLKMKDPQLQGGKEIKLKVRAGAGEDVTAIAGGRVRLNHGNAVKLQSKKVATGKRVTLKLKPKPGSGGNRRIKKALAKGRKAKAEIRAASRTPRATST